MKNGMKIIAFLLVLVMLCGAMTSCAFLPQNLLELPEWHFTGLDPLLSLIFGDSLDGAYQNESGTIRYEFNGESVTVILAQSEYEAILNGTGLTYEGELWAGKNGTAFGDGTVKFETVVPDGTVIKGDMTTGSNVIVMNPDGSFVYDSESGAITGGNFGDNEYYFSSGSLLLSKVMILQGTYEIDDGEIFLKLDMTGAAAIDYVVNVMAGIYSFEEDGGDLYIGSDRLIKVE